LVVVVFISNNCRSINSLSMDVDEPAAAAAPGRGFIRWQFIWQRHANGKSVFGRHGAEQPDESVDVGIDVGSNEDDDRYVWNVAVGWRSVQPSHVQ
jgi:hypothetical protein